ncbi:MAG: TIM barrel protein [Verrucomicrobiota bacterium]|nr:TIM barrel protein [Verrucomicrobiota bacterium]
MSKKKIRWGYAVIYPGDLNIWKGDQLTNKLEFTARNNFKSLQLSLDECRAPERLPQVVDFIQAHDIDIVVGCHLDLQSSDKDARRRKVDTFLENLRTYGPSLRVPIVTTGTPMQRFMRSPSLEEQMDLMADGLADLAKGCHELGRPLGIENHGNHYCSDLVTLCKRVPHLNIFLDTGNCYLIGEKPGPACREAAPYTIGTHFKDHYVHPDPRELKFVIEGAPIGEGDVGLREIYMDLIRLAPNPEKLVMMWEMVPPKDMPTQECIDRSWAFCRSLPDPS